MSNLELFKSPHDGSTIEFRVVRRAPEGIDFELTVETPWFRGRGKSSTYFNGSPGAMFSSMAADWKGWEGTKSWQDLEQQVTLDAVSDSTGHISISVEIRGPNDASLLRVPIQFEAGQLEGIAAAVVGLFGEKQK